MSSINGVGGSVYESRVQEAKETAPAAPTQAASGSGGADPLKAIQGLIKQLETSANTRAIPAHQNW